MTEDEIKTGKPHIILTFLKKILILIKKIEKKTRFGTKNINHKWNT